MLKFQTGIVGVEQLFMHLFSRLAPVLVAFKTDTDISQKAPRRERELQAWQADLSPPVVTSAGPIHGHHNDDITFGAGSSGHAGWNQFTANEKLFGVKTGFDEELYTTKLDRSGADFAEREKRAQALANEIIRVCLSHCPPINLFTVAFRARRITHTSWKSAL
jgi:PAB1-binding protein PBP1